MNNIFEAAKEFEEIGLFPVPFNVEKDGCTSLAKWQEEPHTVDEWNKEFNKANGIGIVCGERSGNLQIIDVDTKHDSTATLSNRFLVQFKIMMPDLYDSAYIEETRSGGLHIVYRRDSSVGAKNIPAKTLDRNKNGDMKEFALIEVLGEGQLCFTYPSKNYRILQGSINELPVVSDSEYSDLINICRSFNELPESEIKPSKVEVKIDSDDKRSGTIFNQSVDVHKFAQFLATHDWSVFKRVDDQYWLTRPGKDSAVSATWNYEGRKQLVVFSSSTDFETHHSTGEVMGHCPFSVLAKLQFDGDFKKTSAYLIKEGYVSKDDWPQIEPLKPNRAESFDLDKMIPADCKEFKNYIEAIAESTQVSPEMVLMPAISLTSLCLSGATELQIMDDWSEPAPIWSIVVAEASERKSPVLKELNKPIRKYYDEFGTKYKREISRLRRDKMAIEAKLETLNKGYQTAVTKNHDEKVQSFSDEIERTEELIDNMPTITSLPNLVQSDITPESLVRQLVINGEVCGVISSEAEPIEVALGLYSGNANFSVYLKGYSVEEYNHNRVGSGETQVREPKVVLSVMMQSEPMSKLASSHVAQNRGVLARTLFAVPNSRLGSRILEPKQIPDSMRSWWHETIRRMMILPHQNFLFFNGTDIDQYTGDTAKVKFSKEAAELFLEARIKNEKSLSDDDSYGFTGKLMGNIARICMSFHFLGNNRVTDNISADTVRSVLNWVEPLYDHYFAAIGMGGADDIERNMIRIIRKLAEKNTTEIKQRDLFRLISTKRMDKAEHWMPILDRMVDLGYVKRVNSEKSAKGGRTSITIHVNPELFEVFGC